ncbi:ZN783 protein, partial [Caloenas nicobarica]|nr:ZN783 protein [Caloenas nicobarica]
VSLWPVVAAVRALERSVGAHAARLLSLERRTVSAEEKYCECRKTVAEFGSQLESKLAVLGTLVQQYGQLQRRLENVENLLKNKNFWILQLPPGDQVPRVSLLRLQVQAMFDSGAAYVSAPEWENLEEWQREPYKSVLRGKNESLISLDYAISKPDLLSRLQSGETPCGSDKVASREIPAEPSAGKYGIPEPSFVGVVKQEEERCVEEHGATEDAEFTELSVEDSIIHIKQEEELCAADEQEEEAGEAPEEPCPGPPEKGEEVDTRELPGAGDEDL